MDGLEGAVVGWRAWRVAETRAGLRLRSGVYDDEWQPGAELAARCLVGGHGVPWVSCSCGIHAARKPGEAARYLVGRDDSDIVHRVVGLVALTGRVVEHERGWRGERGLPVRLWVPASDTNGEPAPAADVVARLGTYGVRVDLVPASVPAAVAAAVDASSHIRHGRVSHVCRLPSYARA